MAPHSRASSPVPPDSPVRSVRPVRHIQRSDERDKVFITFYVLLIVFGIYALCIFVKESYKPCNKINHNDNISQQHNIYTDVYKLKSMVLPANIVLGKNVINKCNMTDTNNIVSCIRDNKLWYDVNFMFH